MGSCFDASTFAHCKMSTRVLENEANIPKYLFFSYRDSFFRIQIRNTGEKFRGKLP